jgi:hypothetical protein
MNNQWNDSILISEAVTILNHMETDIKQIRSRPLIISPNNIIVYHSFFIKTKLEIFQCIKIAWIMYPMYYNRLFLPSIHISLIRDVNGILLLYFYTRNTLIQCVKPHIIYIYFSIFIFLYIDMPTELIDRTSFYCRRYVPINNIYRA